MLPPFSQQELDERPIPSSISPVEAASAAASAAAAAAAVEADAARARIASLERTVAALQVGTHSTELPLWYGNVLWLSQTVNGGIIFNCQPS